MTPERSVVYQLGWQSNGEWHCPICSTIIGRNLLNAMPFALAREHVENVHSNSVYVDYCEVHNVPYGIV